MIQFYNQVRYKVVVRLNHIIWDEHKVATSDSSILIVKQSSMQSRP